MTAESQQRARIASFLQLAQEEFEAADKLSGPLPRQAAYFVQQSVEKLLRAVLEKEGIAAGPSHNNRYLCELLPDHHLLKSSFVAFDPLSAASTRYRYPNPSGGLSSPAAADVHDWLVRLRALREQVKAHIQI